MNTMTIAIFFVATLATVAIATDFTVPPVPHADVTLEIDPNAETAIQNGRNFVMVCKIQATFPQNSSTMWTGDTGFYHDDQLLGVYKKSYSSPSMAYHTKSFSSQFNAWPATDLTYSTQELRSNYSLVIMPKTNRVVGSFKCSVTLHPEVMSMNANEHPAEARFFSNSQQV